MNSFYKIIFSLILLLIATTFVQVQAQTQAFNFYRNLKVGDVGQDVLELQKILNQDSDTRVAVSGVGSIGNETTYFGNLTKNALVKFQNKYRSEVLAPVGLIQGTGYFGPSTISFIKNKYQNNVAYSNNNQQESKKDVDLKSDYNDNLEISFDDKKEELISDEKKQSDNKTTNQSDLIRSDSTMEVYFVSQKVFESGDDLTVVGTGVNSNSEIYFFNFENDKVVSDVDIESNFMMFEAPNLPVGEYELYIKNGNYISKPLVVEIVDSYNPPKISSISPSVIEYGDTVTIKGSGFENENTVMTALGTYSARSSGNEIKFTVDRPSNINIGGEITDPVEQKVEGVIQVQNSNGISDAQLVDFLYN